MYSVGAYRSRSGLGAWWYFCRCAVRFVIGEGAFDSCFMVVLVRLFSLFLRILRLGLVISEWLGPAPIWPLGLDSVE